MSVPASAGAVPRISYAALAVGVAATGWAAILFRLADEAPALTVAAYRLLFATIVVAAVAAPRWWSVPRAALSRRTMGLLLLSGVLLAAHFWAWFESLERTSVGSSVVIVGMQPLLAAGLGFVFLREAPGRREYAGIGLATVGLVIIGGRDFASSPGELGGDALALLGALLAAGYRTVGRELRPGMSTLTYSAAVYAIAAAVLWLLVAGFRPATGGFGGDTWTYLVLLALVPQVIGHTAFNWALIHFRVVTVSIANMGEPIVATLLAIPILSERPTLALAIGGPIIIAGVVVGLSERSRG